MAGKIFAFVFLVSVFYGATAASSPRVNSSFIAWGEIVQPLQDSMGLVLQMNFEESYDLESDNAAFFLWFGGKNLTFVKKHNTSQALMYMVSDDNKLKCMVTTEKEWSESDFEASLLSFEDDKGMVKFSLKQLFDIPDKYMTEKLRGMPTVYRGIPANAWTYEIKTKDKQTKKDVTLSITAYWANGTNPTSAGMKMSPLGFNVSKITWTDGKTSDDVPVEDYYINVYGFVHDAYDHKYFKPVEGVECDGRIETLQFPSVKEIRAISLHSEVVMPGYQEIRYADTYFDPVSKLARVDVERMKDEDPLEHKNRRYQSEVSIGKMGVVYRFGWHKGESNCDVIPFSKYENDLQNFFDVKQKLIDWKIGKLFGLNDTTYVYTGKAIKNDVPCHMFQGRRSDWPDKKAGVVSLWEWCFNVNMSKPKDVVMFLDGEFGLISAQITILSHPNSLFVGYRMNHHFYEVKEQDPKILDSTSFDISRCYTDLEKRILQFPIDMSLDLDTSLLAKNATSDINFLRKWKSTLYTFTKLTDYSLRISNVRSTVEGKTMYIKFSILDIHKDLPKDTKSGMISSSDAEKNLRESIDAGKVSIKHEWKKGEAPEFKAAKGGLSYQIDPKFDPVTVPPRTTTEPTKRTPPNFSLRTPPPRKEPTIVQRYTGHQPGSVAGVSIAMLLVGISIGCAGTFYKFHGLPAFMRK